MEAMTKLAFEINWNKSIEGLHYLVSIHPGITPFYIAKIFYYADKQHMTDWGRPISGDTYFAMENGPVPSSIYDIIKKDEFLDDNIITNFENRIKKEGRNLYSREAFNQVFLSNSDIEYLHEADKVYGHMSTTALWNLVHKEKAYQEAWKNRKGMSVVMDMSLMIEENIANRDELLKEIQEKTVYAITTI